MRPGDDNDNGQVGCCDDGTHDSDYDRTDGTGESLLLAVVVIVASAVVAAALVASGFCNGIAAVRTVGIGHASSVLHRSLADTKEMLSTAPAHPKSPACQASPWTKVCTVPSHKFTSLTAIS